MSIQRGCFSKEGWLVKSTKDGTPNPLNTRLFLIFKEAGVTTLCGALDYGARKFGNKSCLGTRDLLKRQKNRENGRVFEKLKLGEYTWRTYVGVKEMAEKIGWALRTLNLNPGDRTAIFAETRAEWFISAMGCFKQRITCCTLYATLSDESLEHAINETEVNVVFTSFELLTRFKKVLSQCPMVKTLIVFEDQLDKVDLSDFSSNLNVILFSDLVIRGELAALQPVPVPDSEDTAIIMYTSGSTGTPKGVQLSHSNILTSVMAYSIQMNVGPDDRYIAYLPLAHIMELASEVALVALGVSIFYSSPLTLTDKGPKIMKDTTGDINVAKPTLMNAVPLVLERIIKGIFSVVEKGGWIKNFIFNTVVRNKFWLDYIPFFPQILDLIIFHRIKDQMGGCLKRMIVGGAPLSPETHSLMRTIFDVSIQVGYASTETSSCTTGMDEDEVDTGHTGGPTAGVYLKLVNWEEGGYLTTDLPNPRGEIIAGGPCIAKGYFKQNQETVGAFYEEDGLRWFRTGDIGELFDNGCIKIIDRKKDLVKLKHGEYVSLSNAESKLKTLSIVDNICVFADSTQDKTVAVVIPSTEKLYNISKAVGIDDESITIEELCVDESVKAVILKDLQSHGRKRGLTRWEIPADVHLSPDSWTPDSGLVTAALKLRRKQLGRHYQNMIKEMYSRLD